MASGGNIRDFRLSLALNRKDCENLIQESRSRQQPTHGVEGLLYWARFVVLERSRSASLSDADMTTLVDRAHNQLDLARTTCNTYPGQTAGMPAEVSEAEKMLRDSTFYAPVTNLEKAGVYAAMAQSFQGTGRWYSALMDILLQWATAACRWRRPGVPSVRLLWVGPTINLQTGLGGQKTWKRSLGGEGGRSR